MLSVRGSFVNYVTESSMLQDNFNNAYFLI